MLLTKVVLRLEPLTWTTDPFTNFVPFTVRVKAGPPAKVVLGEMLVSEGTGLLTVKMRGALVPPEEVTVMERDPALARSPAVSVAVNWVLLTKAVLRLAPLTWTSEVAVKFVPVAVSVSGPLPAIALEGEIPVKVGAVVKTVRF